MVQNRNIVSPTYGTQIAEGSVPGVKSIRRMGHNLDVSASWETVWCRSALYTYLTTASKIDVYSSSVQDAQNGTGAKTLFIKGLDANYDVISETLSTHATNGQTSVTSVKSYLRVFAIRVVTSGSNSTNVGNITFEDSTGLITLAYMHASEGKTLMSIYTVPDDKTATILRWSYGEVNAKRTHIALFIRPFGESWYIGKYKVIKNQTGSATFAMPVVFAAKTDIEIRAYSEGGSGKVQGMFEGYYQ